MAEKESAKTRERYRDLAALPARRQVRKDQERVSGWLKPVLATLEADFLDPRFRVASLWRKHGIHDKTVATRFKEEVGQLPKLYLSRCRLRTAARLLTHTKLRVAEVVGLSGFGSRTAFERAFAAAYGRTPEAFRQDPDPDPDPWPAALEPQRIAAALAGRLSPPDLRQLCREVSLLAADVAGRYEKTLLSDLLATADEALREGDYDAALAVLSRAEEHPDAGDLCRSVAARKALAAHATGSVLTVAGDVDRGFEALALARGEYARAGELPPDLATRRRHLASHGISCDTDAVLLGALCPGCRRRLLSDLGRPVRDLLRRALEPAPRTSAWLARACDGCYRVIWQALGLARLGLLDDAFQAWWLVQEARPHLGNPEAPASVGRVAAALAEVERRAGGDAAERLAYCDLALAAATALANPSLEALCRVWRGRILTALARYPEARAEFGRAARDGRRDSGGPVLAPRWLEALRKRMEGLLADSTNDYRRALRLLAAAAKLYKDLDPHLAGLLFMQQANVHFFQGNYRKALAVNHEALCFLDSRRDPLQEAAVLPIYTAAALGALGRWQAAELALSRCDFDRARHPALAAAEIFTRGCLWLGREQPAEALASFTEARRRFEELHRFRAAGLASTYSVEAYTRLGRHAEAVTAARAAARFFEDAGCPQDTLVALLRLQELLASGAVDGTAVTTAVRRLARGHGGWLPGPIAAPSNGGSSTIGRLAGRP